MKKTHLKTLIKQAHHNLTTAKGRPEYAPTTREIEEEIKLILQKRNEIKRSSGK